MLDSSTILYEDKVIVITEYSEYFNTDKKKILFQLKIPNLSLKNNISNDINNYLKDRVLYNISELVDTILSSLYNSSEYKSKINNLL